MSVLQQNPFLAGFGAVMVIGVGALGYLAYSAMDENSQARKKYDENRSELTSLQGSSIHPDDANLKKVRALKQAVQAKVNGLQRDLAATKIKVEPIQPGQFQDKLTNTVVSLADRAVEAKVKYPGNEKENNKERFFFGFDAYKSTPPKPEAAPALYRQLKAIEAVINIILETKNVDISEVTRGELREEKDKPAPAPPKGGGAKEEKAAKSVVDHQSFNLRFTTTQDNFQKILNDIVGYKQQIYVVRTVALHNSMQEPPPKIAGVADAGVPPPAPPVPNNPNTPPAPVAPGVAPAAPAAPEAPAAPQEKKVFIFGKELIEASLQIDIVDVQEPAALPVEKAAAKK